MAVGDFLPIADKQTLEETKTLIDTRANELKTQADGIKTDTASILDKLVGDTVPIAASIGSVAQNSSVTIYSVTGKGRIKYLKVEISGQAAYQETQVQIIADGEAVATGSDLGILINQTDTYKGFYFTNSITFKTSLVIKASVGSGTYGGKALGITGLLELL